MTINLKTIVPPILILLFLMPATLVSFIPMAIRNEYYYIVVFIFWITSFLFFFKPVFFKKDESSTTLFTILLLCAGTMTLTKRNDEKI
jgi:hypothetical protein